MPDTTLTITIIGADVPGLIEKLAETVAKLGATADAVTQAIPAIQGDVKEAVDAIKAFKIAGPFGMKGGAA